MSLIAAFAIAASGVSAGERLAGGSKAAASKHAARPAKGGAALGETAPADAARLGADTRKDVRLVFRLKNVPATDAAKAITEFLRSEPQPRGPRKPASQGASALGVTIVPEPISNSLLISGRPPLVDEVQKLVSDLDITPPTVLIEVVIGEAPAGNAKPAEGTKPDPKTPASASTGPFHAVAKPPHMETIARLRLSTLDNQAAYIHIGQRIPLFAGVSVPAGAAKETQPTFANVGLILGVTPRVSPAGPVFMEVDVEDSRLGTEQEGIPIAVPGGQVVRTPRVETTMVQTTVRVPNGETIVLGSVAGRGKSDKELFILLTPHVLERDKGK